MQIQRIPSACFLLIFSASDSILFAGSPAFLAFLLASCCFFWFLALAKSLWLPLAIVGLDPLDVPLGFRYNDSTKPCRYMYAGRPSIQFHDPNGI